MKKSCKKLLALVLTGLLCTTFLTACGDDYTAEDLRNAQERRLNGQKLNREDSNMLKGYDKWKANQNKYADY